MLILQKKGLKIAKDKSPKEKEASKKDEQDSTILSSYTEIPTSILQDRSFAVLETIVAYLKDTYNLTYHEIALLLDRDDRTIWTCYDRVKKKGKKPFKQYEKSVEIPLHAIRNREVSILESIAFHMKEAMGLSYHEIALLLNRNDRTIWTCYQRAKIKQSKEKGLQKGSARKQEKKGDEKAVSKEIGQKEKKEQAGKKAREKGEKADEQG